MVRLRSYVAGKWVKGEGSPRTLVNPATEETLAEVTSGGIDFGAALAHARDVGGPALRKLTFAERGALLKEMSRALHAEREHLLEVSTANNGATRGDSKFDIDGATGTLSAYAYLSKELGDRSFLVDGEALQLTRAPRYIGQHVRMPIHGAAVHIGAFNFPGWGTFEKAAVALLAGVPVITKPATATALVAYEMAKIIIEAGILPDGALSFIAGSTGDLLDRLGPQDAVAFTGSAATANKLRANPALLTRSVRFNVEADSLNAAVLAPDVEVGSDLWHLFVRNVVTDLQQKTGQKCTAVRRVVVPAERADEVSEALADELSRIVVGNPTQAGITMGPVATKSQLEDCREGIRFLAEQTQLVTGGADPIQGEGAPEGKGFFVRPTLLRAKDAAEASRVHEREVFGPCTTVLPYDGSTDAAARIVGLAQGSLVTSFYTDDKGFMGEFLAGASPWNGRILAASSKVADQVTPPGMVLPTCTHGGPGRAGGGEELGGVRGLDLYTQRTAIQGDRGLLGRVLGTK